jgi:hypothetical protein
VFLNHSTAASAASAAWGDQADRDGIEELPARQPVMLDHDSLAQERHDGQAAAEDKCAGLEEEQSQRSQNAGGCRALDPGHPPSAKGRDRVHRCFAEKGRRLLH